MTETAVEVALGNLARTTMNLQADLLATRASLVSLQQIVAILMTAKDDDAKVAFDLVLAKAREAHAEILESIEDGNPGVAALLDRRPDNGVH